MQFSISDEAAIVFADELFTSLIGRQYAIDAAVSEARKAVFAEVNEIEWATPVLFLRTFDGLLFNFTAAPESIPLKVAPLSVIVVDDSPTIRHPHRHPDREKRCRPRTSPSPPPPPPPPAATVISRHHHRRQRHRPHCHRRRRQPASPPSPPTPSTGTARAGSWTSQQPRT